MTTPAGPHAGAIDLDRLMDDLKRRVEDRRAAAEIDPRILHMPFTVEGGENGAGTASVRLRPETAYSSKPIVGRPVTIAKRSAIRFLYHFLNDLVGQLNTVLARLDEAQQGEERAREAVEARTGRIEDEVSRLQRRISALEAQTQESTGRSPGA